MAITHHYPKRKPKNSDLLVGTSIPDPNTNDDPKTSNFSVSSIGSLLIEENNIITGGGTPNTIAMFTPDGTAVGDSNITQDVSGKLFMTRVTINNNLAVDGSVTLGDSSADITTVNSTLSILSVVKDSNDTLGTDGQILVANSASELLWSSINDISEIKTAQATITDAQIRTLGTVPVEILPGVTGYIYEILGVTTQSINSGGLGDAYDWDNSGDGVIYGQGFQPNEHRAEIPNGFLPDGGPINGEPYVATPIAGLFRGGSGVKVSTTLGVDPTIPIAQTPVAQWVINITYKLTQVQ